MKCLDEDSNYDPDVEDRMSNSSEHVSEASQNVNTDTSDKPVFSLFSPKIQKPNFLSLSFNKC